MKNPSVVALLTDFGHQDVYVGVMKGVILARNREVQFIDLCHECSPGNIREAAFLLYSAWEHLPADTIVLSVVDPGVGSARREIISSQGSITYVGPDNGTISLVNRFHPIAKSHRADDRLLRELSEGQSATFHGRDLFAPLAAELSLGKMVLGEECSPLLIDPLAGVGDPSIDDRVDNQSIDRGAILHVDGFGNLITSFYIGDYNSIEAIEALVVSTRQGRERFGRIESYFGEVDPGEPIVYIGSTGFIEIAARDASASELWSIDAGDLVELVSRRKPN